MNDLILTPFAKFEEDDDGAGDNRFVIELNKEKDENRSLVEDEDDAGVEDEDDDNESDKH